MKLQLLILAISSSQKGSTQVEQVQISPDAGARPISTLEYRFWDHQFVSASKLRTKSQPTMKSQEDLG